jgi:hypothetical protein
VTTSLHFSLSSAVRPSAWAALLQVNVNKVWLTVSSVLLGLSFIFGNSIRNVFESVVFLFVVHPFDVGDALLVTDPANSGDGPQYSKVGCSCHPALILLHHKSALPSMGVHVIQPMLLRCSGGGDHAAEHEGQALGWGVHIRAPYKFSAFLPGCCQFKLKVGCTSSSWLIAAVVLESDASGVICAVPKQRAEPESADQPVALRQQVGVLQGAIHGHRVVLLPSAHTRSCVAVQALVWSGCACTSV